MNKDQTISNSPQTHQQESFSAAFLLQVVNAISDPVFVKDRQHRWVLLNDAFCQFMGVSQEKLLGKSDYDFFPKEQADVFWKKDELVFTTGIINENEELFTDTQGLIHVIFTKKSLFEDGAGNQFLVGTIRDITEHKQAEEALRRSNAVLQAQQEAALDGILIIDENRRVASYNQRFAELWQIPQTVIQTGDDRQLLQSVLDQLENPEEFLAKVEYLYQHPEESSRDEISLKQGRIFDRYSAPVRSPLGNYFGRIWYFRNITERKQAEATLQKQEQFLRSIYDGVDQLIFVVDVLENNDFRYAGWNSPTERITGISSADGVGKSPEDIHGEVQAQAIRQQYMECVVTGKSFTNEEYLSFQGQETWLLTTLNPLKDNSGQVYRIVGTTFDISDRKRAEIQLKQQAKDLEKTLQQLQHTQIQLIQSEKMSSLGQLVAGVAHEINNPTSFIFGNLIHAKEYVQDLLKLVQLYQRYYPDSIPEIQAQIKAIDLDFLIADLPKLLNSMEIGAERIRQIVLSLRTFSRMDEAEMKEVDIHEGIDSTLMILAHRLKDQGDRSAIEVIKEYGNLIPVECYAGQINQVFMNILTNAIDALEESLVNSHLSLVDKKGQRTTPQIRICTLLTTNNKVKIKIADNGPGIPETVKQRLFDPFFTTKPIGKGTGMGLSISYQIITERHGGSLECISQPGSGAEFVISIPLRQT
ncbi:PAS domain-containing sensor histidine kinase [Fischerella sp. PCC 9605]|uniref:PAS domain-containing sensor histidine kinase n=1 Tax=Fischerella sp. PCC 9605 TaxID=1173024 RepID=UPI0004BAB815|nr:PAS domain-containing protein [Fischerella sp. PCC 9605]